MFPDLVSAASNLPIESVILDGEAIAIDPKTGKLLDFQETVKRKRKHNIEQMKEEIPLKVFLFDLVYLNGETYLNKPLSERRAALEEIFKNVPSDSLFALTDQRIVGNPLDFKTYFEEVAGQGLEGLMVKKTDAPYRAGKRDFTWVKYKVGMQSELADTVDGVVLGYFKGEGKWTQFGMGKVLVGIPDKGKYYALTKVGSGFSEEKIKEMVERATKIELKEKPPEYIVDQNLIPDVWVKPEIMVEIRADSVSRSPVYATGLSLRFPRFIRFRDDKDIAQATSLSQLKSFISKNKG
jgi:DNA ligase 1